MRRDPGMPRIALLTTGGTIATRRASDGGLILAEGPAMIADVASAVAGGDLVVDEVFRKSSFDLEIGDLLQIVRRVRQEVEAGHAVVVTHGTDAMAETAFLTSLYVPHQSTVVFSGSQLSADHVSSDGPRNVRDAIVLASHPAAPAGVVICFGGAVIAAWAARKSHSTSLVPFDGGDAGALARVDGDTITTLAATPDRAWFAGYDVPSDLPRVELVTLVSGMDPTLLERAVAAGARGVVIEAFGVGNASMATARTVRQLVQSGIPVVVTTRCERGPIMPLYHGGGVELAAGGAVFASGLSGSKARLALMCCLAAAPDPAAAVDLLSSLLSTVTSEVTT